MYSLLWFFSQLVGICAAMHHDQYWCWPVLTLCFGHFRASTAVKALAALSDNSRNVHSCIYIYQGDVTAGVYVYLSNVEYM
jgi:hypothetical protein